MTEPILKMEKINKYFGNLHVLKDVNFNAYRGQVNVLIGENGAGKSTLMKILAGVHQQDSGIINYDNNVVEITNPLEAEEIGIGTVYQELNLIPELSIAENIYLGTDLITGKLGTVKWKEIYSKSREIVKNLLGVEIDPKQRISRLGIAQQQMIEIAKVLNRNIKLLIMDEPTAALTNKEIDKLFEIIRKLKEKGIAIIYISHRLEEIFQIGDNITVLRDGQVVGNVQVKDSDYDSLIKMMVGREISNYFPKENFDEIEKKELMRVEGLTRENVFKDISFSVRTGEILGIAGLMGAGRTEIVRGIFGADEIDSGKVIIEGKEVKVSSPNDAIKNGLALLPEDRKGQGLITKRNILENTTIANLSDYCNNYGVINKIKESKDVNKYVKDLRIVTTGITKVVKELSGGNQQKVVIAKWVCANSKIVIFDEPTRGIDVGAKVEVYKLINNLIRQNKAVIIISSEMPELIGICDRILTVKDGKITGEFEGEVTQEQLLSCMVGGV